jgi:uncharacterized protein with ParB-like and HNH nuclease domain
MALKSDKAVDMKARQGTLLGFLGEPDAAYAIPLFQRRYSWTSEQCDELWRDIVRAGRAHSRHFAGTVLYTPADGGKAHIVDGQQRLTSAMLMLSALAQHLESRGESVYGMDAEGIRSTYLYSHGSPKLTVSEADREAFEAALKGESADGASSRAFENRQRFSAFMEDGQFDPELFWRGLMALDIILAELDADDDAQAIFESFNAKGVPLVTADLVRNHLLIVESPREQRRLYESYWEPIVGQFGDDPGSLKLNNAILAWMTIRCKGVRAIGGAGAFAAFKCYCEDEFDGTSEELLKELFSFSMVWAENYHYHAMKKFRSADWASLGKKTLVSDRPLAPCDTGTREEWQKRYGIEAKQ